jgi:hypothetical protein
MQATKHGYDTNLSTNLRPQMQSLFIGAILNETSLIDYATTKRLIAYSKGYDLNTLTKMQKKIDSVKRLFPKHYKDMRAELLYQLSNPRSESRFFICDRYINSFLSIVFMNSNSIYLAYDRFCAGYRDKY